MTLLCAVARISEISLSTDDVSVKIGVVQKEL